MKTSSFILYAVTPDATKVCDIGIIFSEYHSDAGMLNLVFGMWIVIPIMNIV